jgi:signal transduction histidine kinase
VTNSHLADQVHGASHWRPALVYALVAIALVAVAFQGSVSLIGGGFPGFVVWDNGVLVSFHRPSWTGVRAGLPFRTGVVVGVDGAPFGGGRSLREHAAGLEPGTDVRYRVREGDRVRDVAVPTMRFSAADFLLTFGNYLAGSLALLAIGALALALRPDLAAARGLATAAGATGGLLALVVDYLSAHRLVVATQLVEVLTPVAVLSFALVFPEERLSRAARRNILLASALPLLAWGGLSRFAFYDDPARSRSFVLVTYLAIVAAVLALVTLHAVSLVRAHEPRKRLRAAVVFAGALPAVLLFAIPTLGFALLGWSVSSTWSTAALPLIPAAMLLAIVRHDLLEAGRFVRTTVGYTVATATVLVSYVVAVGVLDWGVAGDDSPLPPARLFPEVGIAVAIAIAFDPLRRAVQRSVDRWFFRSRLDPGAALRESSHQLASLLERPRIEAAVAARLESVLGLEWAEVGPAESTHGVVALRYPVRFGEEPLGEVRCSGKVSGAPFSDAERELVAGLADQAALALHNARTVAELHDAQRESLRRQRLATIGEFARAVAHGLRNPLSTIRAGAQRALAGRRPEELEEILESVVQESDRLDQRIGALLGFSETKEPRPRPTDLAALLRRVGEAMRGQAERHSVEIELEVPQVSVERAVDENLMTEALLELATNAIRAMPEGGRLDLRLEIEPGGVCVRVTDTGHGIPAAVRDRIFDIFFSTRPFGTGLGLPTVRRIAEAQGGSVELLESRPGETVFALRLPVES